MVFTINQMSLCSFIKLANKQHEPSCNELKFVSRLAKCTWFSTVLFVSSKCINYLRCSSLLGHIVLSKQLVLGRHLWFLSQVMDLPPRSRLITSFKRQLQYIYKAVLKGSYDWFKEKGPQRLPTCVFSHHFSFFDASWWIHDKKMLSVVQTTSAVEL